MKKIVAFLILLLLTCNVTYAEENLTSNKINLEQAIELAKKNNLDITAEKMNIEAAKNSIKIANRLQNPNLFTFFNYGKAGYGNPQQFGVSQTIEIAKRRARKNLAKSNLELVKDNYGCAEFNLKMDIRQAYVDLVAAKSILKVTEEQEKLLKELLTELKKTAEKKHDDSSQMDAMQTEIALNQLVTEINTARVNVQSAKFNFNKVLNLKDDSDILYDTQDEILPRKTDFIMLLTPKPKDKIPEFKEISNRAFEKRFDLIIAKQEIDFAQKNLIATIRQKVPDIGLMGGYSFQPSSHSGGEGYLSGAYAGMELTNIPIFYNYSPEIKNAKIQMEQSELKYNSTKNIAAHDLNSAYEKFKIAKLNLNHYNENILDKSNELMALSRKSYASGKSNLTTVIMIEQSYQAVQTGYINALSQYYDCWIDFLKEVNDEEFILETQNI